MPLILITAVLILAVLIRKWFFGYWDKQNVVSFQSQFSSFNHHLAINYKLVYDGMKSKKLKYSGVFRQLTPTLILADLDLVRKVMSKDFGHFSHRGLYYNERGDPLSCHIFNTGGTKWKNMRTKLNPLFAPSKSKELLFAMLKSKYKLEKIDTGEPIDVKKVAESYISGIIEECVFGVKWLDREEDSFFQRLGEKIFARSKTRRIKGYIVDNFPLLGSLLNIALIPKDASDFFLKVVTETVNSRKLQTTPGGDFISSLSKNLEVEEIAAQCFIFFLAAMSTSPATISFALYELSRNQKVQDVLRKAISDVLSQHQEITVEAIEEMKYLDQIFHETLRKYPPAAYLNRKCTKDYKMPDGVVIKENTMVTIPVLGIHHDEALYPNPETFDPERFNKNNCKLRDGYAFLPFGAGPRACIGTRFGQLQTKLAIITLTERFRFTVSPKTKEPLKMRSDLLVLTAEGGLWLNAKNISR